MRVNCIIPRRWPYLLLSVLLATAWTYDATGQRADGDASAVDGAADVEPASSAEAGDAAQDPADPDAAEADPEQMDPATRALWDQFIASTRAWAKTVAGIHEVQIRFHNGSDEQSEALRRQYRQLRAAGRHEYDRALADALALVDHQQGGSPIVGEFLLHAIATRTQMDWLEGIAQGADLLLQLEVDFPGLYSAAGRGYVVEGEYERARPFLKKAAELAQQEAMEKGDKADMTDPMLLATLDQSHQQWQREQRLRAADAAAGDLPRVLLKTTRGDVVVELFEDQAPNTVANFISLVEQGFYDELPFYQVLEHLYAQTGDPVGDGSGDAGYRIADERDAADARDVFRGSLVMAKLPNAVEGGTRTVPDTASSQFMIAFLPLVAMSEEYTVFGRVIEGMPAVATLTRQNPNEKSEDRPELPPDRILSAEVIRKRDHAYEVDKLPIGGR